MSSHPRPWRSWTAASFEELKKKIMKTILTKEAIERLGRIRLVKPDLALQIELYLVQLYQAGKLKGQILDEVAELELEHHMPLSVLVLSEEQFNHLKKRERRIALDIEREGIPL
jgi:hypothetical protein